MTDELFALGMKRDWPIFKKWVTNGECLNIGPGNQIIAGTIPIDLPEYDANQDPIPFANRSIDTIHCYHMLEHVDEPLFFLKECQRVLKYGGLMNIVVPYYTCQMAYQDITHTKFFTLDTFGRLFNNHYYTPLAIEWELTVVGQIACGILDRNICLMAQLERV